MIAEFILIFADKHIWEIIAKSIALTVAILFLQSVLLIMLRYFFTDYC